MIDINLADASIGVSVVSLVTAIAALNRKPQPPAVKADVHPQALPPTKRRKSGPNRPKVTVDPLEGKFTREQLIAVARAAKVGTSAWRANARKADLFITLRDAGLVK